jgi:hypothetical protein
LYWRQSELPFDERTRAYIAALDADADLALLAAQGIPLRLEAQRVFRVLTMLLQKAAARSLNAYEIGCIASRANPSVRSPLEKLHGNALRMAACAMRAGGDAWPEAMTPQQEGAYMAAMAQLLDEFLEEFVIAGDEMLL